MPLTQRQLELLRASPDTNTCRRVVAVGGMTKGELLDRLRSNSIALNRYAEMIFDSDCFTTSKEKSRVSTIELEVQGLGFPQGATLADILATAATAGLGCCPLELAPHIRLQYVDQPEGATGQAARPHQTPPGAIIIVSAPLEEEDDFPRGFYLRRIDGVLWLRGYCAPITHIHAPDEHFLFREL
jgi:hypothetical protein